MVHHGWEGGVRIKDYTADFEGAGLAAQTAVFVFLGEVAHEAVERDEVGFAAPWDGTGEIYEASVGGSFPQCPSGGIVGCWAAVALAPCFYVFDGVFLFPADRAVV